MKVTSLVASSSSRSMSSAEPRTQGENKCSIYGEQKDKEQLSEAVSGILLLKVKIVQVFFIQLHKS